MQANKDPELKEMKKEYERSYAERVKKEEKIRLKKEMMDRKVEKKLDPVV